MENFWARVQKTETCWLWIGGKTEKGYGNFSTPSGYVLAHRFSYFNFKGELIDGLTIDHLCRNHDCVNPEHLEQVTIQENIIRAVPFRKKSILRHQRTHCLNAHEYNKENTILLKVGGRICKQCLKIKRPKRKLNKNNTQSANSIRVYKRSE